MSADPNCTICKGTGHTVSYSRGGFGMVNRCRCNSLDYSPRTQIAWALRYIKEKYAAHNSWSAWPKKEEDDGQ